MILAIDVGKGTEDVMIYDNQESITNSIQLVFPSSAQILKRNLEKDRSTRIVISGDLMAGEPWHKIVYQKCENYPLSVIMSKTAARSLRYNLKQVEERGVKIVPDDEIHLYEATNHYSLSDINWLRIENVILQSGYDKEDIETILLSCQDHGEPSDINQSVRDFRMKTIYVNLRERGRLDDLLVNSELVPKTLPRHRSICQSAINNFDHITKNNVYVMDSSPAVILGALGERDSDKEIIINAGNGHTLAVFLKKKGIVQAIYEMHTSGITPRRIMEDLSMVAQNKLSHEEALARGGHGIYYREEMNLDDKSFRKLLPITLIGPRRSNLSGLDVKNVHPSGNMMMAGPIGLIKAFENKYQII